MYVSRLIPLRPTCKTARLAKRVASANDAGTNNTGAFATEIRGRVRRIDFDVNQQQAFVRTRFQRHGRTNLRDEIHYLLLATRRVEERFLLEPFDVREIEPVVPSLEETVDKLREKLLDERLESLVVIVVHANSPLSKLALDEHGGHRRESQEDRVGLAVHR